MKRRIFLGLLPIIILFVGVGLYAVWLFTQLGGSIDTILRENYQSVLAGQQMKESAERMDSGLAFALAGEEKRGHELFDANAPIFHGSLAKELNNITLPGEGELAAKIKESEDRYQSLAKSFWTATDIGARREMYFSQLLPLFTEIKNNAQAVIDMNQENMVQADHHARSLSKDSTRAMFLLVLIGVGLALFFGYGLQRAILKPIQTLTAVSKELGDGKLDQIVPVQSKDELGELADAFNELATKLRAYRQVTTDQILQARQMMEITFSAFPDPILALSLDGKINFANPAAGKLLQKLNIEHGLPLAIQKEVENVLKGAPDCIPASFENSVPVRLDDHEAFLLPKTIGMRDESGNLFGAAVVLQDVTRFRLMDEVKTNLVSTVSHELKTPLTSIRMGLHLLLEEKIGSLNAKQLELLLAAREDSERLLRMINDLLDLAHLESGQTRQRLEVVSPRTLIDDALPNLRSLVEAHDARLVADVAPELPEVAVNSRQISHVFSNLVSNAARFSKLGNDVVLSVKSVGKMVRSVCSITDRASRRNINPAFLKGSSGYRGAKNPKASDSVSQLSRKSCFPMAETGGNVGLRSTPGEGSEFYFDLPATGKNSNGMKP